MTTPPVGMKIMRATLLLLFQVCAGSVCPADGVSRGLPRSSPEKQGISSAAILAFVEAADEKIDTMNSIMLVRHGHVVAEGWWSPYDAKSRHMLFSLSKSFTSTAVGLVITDGKLSLDDEVLKFFPEDAPAEPSNNLKGMRVRDLLCMSTGSPSRGFAGCQRALDKGVPRARSTAQTGHSLSLQYARYLHAFGHCSESDRNDVARLSAAAAVRTAGN